VREGFVDFILPEPTGQTVPLELKPLFKRDGEDAKPEHHVPQVKKYLADNEDLVLTDLRTAWFFSARDFFFESKPFHKMPFAGYRLLKIDVVKILPNLELNFHCADSLVDVELPKQVEWLAEYHQAELKKLSELRARYIENPMLHESLDEALALRNKVRANFIEHFQGENLPCEPGGFAVHFWPCWFTVDGKPKVGQASRLSSERVSASVKENKEISSPTSPVGAGERHGDKTWVTVFNYPGGPDVCI